MDEGKPTIRVKPIRFKSIPEDNYNNEDVDDHSIPKGSVEELRNFELIQEIRKLKPNFSFEYSYPAVIFDKVCFSIDRTQQQANFLDECFFKLRRCISPASDNSKQKVEILKSIDLSVPYGTIFGLLGPSSCGKTTLLRCLVGLLRPNSGSIRLFCNCSEDFDDDNQGSEGKSFEGCCSRSRRKSLRRNKCKVPGSNVGYMPQDLGLYEDFTIRQLLTMFGRYMRMGSKLIASRIEFMVSFLDLPHVDREICSLSGGQKRRVSFAIACLHMPPLIILDEPTVGVDPLLRKSIWKYLRRLADEENKTIIITTHYIEEAAQADQVAFMRAGEILVQDTPSRIMELNHCRTLEEAFLKICNNVQSAQQQQQQQQTNNSPENSQKALKLYPQPRFNWHDKLKSNDAQENFAQIKAITKGGSNQLLKDKNEANVNLGFDGSEDINDLKSSQTNELYNVKLEDTTINKLSMEPSSSMEISFQKQFSQGIESGLKLWKKAPLLETNIISKNAKIRSFRGQKLIINEPLTNDNVDQLSDDTNQSRKNSSSTISHQDKLKNTFKFQNNSEVYRKVIKSLTLMWALLYKNYRRNVNSLPLLAFQFMLPIIQMISFSLCVGGKPTNIGLGLVNHDQLTQLNRSHLLMPSTLLTTPNININGTQTNSSISDLNNSTSLLDNNNEELLTLDIEELLSDRYLSFVDQSIITIRPYSNLKDALADVRKAKLWAAMEISENFTTAILKRFDLENFYQLDIGTMKQSVIRLYPDRSNKVLDMICQRSLVNSYRKFLLDQFEHFKKLPIEVKEPIFSIKPNLISNSIDGYTESIAAGLLASLTYIMAAGLTTFIMVVERSAGILERTYTSGINPVAYLIAHAAFRSFVMMLQIAVVLFLTFYILQQPLVGSIWLAYVMLMTLNLTGITYGLLISSIVSDQNGAALTIVSSLVVKITLSGILWPFEAIPRWLRTICYIQPLTMPIQALKNITLKGSGLEDRTVQLGFLVSLSWLALFLTVAAKRFKFYQH